MTEETAEVTPPGSTAAAIVYLEKSWQAAADTPLLPARYVVPSSS